MDGQLHLSWTGKRFKHESSTGLEAGDWAPVELPFISVAAGNETRHTAVVKEPTGLESARFCRLTLIP